MQLPKKEFNCMCCCAKTPNKIAVKKKDVWTPKTYPPVKFLLNAQSVNIGNSIHSRQVPSHSPTKKNIIGNSMLMLNIPTLKTNKNQLLYFE